MKIRMLMNNQDGGQGAGNTGGIAAPTVAPSPAPAAAPAWTPADLIGDLGRHFPDLPALTVGQVHRIYYAERPTAEGYSDWLRGTVEQFRPRATAPATAAPTFQPAGLTPAPPAAGRSNTGAPGGSGGAGNMASSPRDMDPALMRQMSAEEQRKLVDRWRRSGPNVNPYVSDLTRDRALGRGK